MKKNRFFLLTFICIVFLLFTTFPMEIQKENHNFVFVVQKIFNKTDTPIEIKVSGQNHSKKSGLIQPNSIYLLDESFNSTNNCDCIVSLTETDPRVGLKTDKKKLIFSLFETIETNLQKFQIMLPSPLYYHLLDSYILSSKGGNIVLDLEINLRDYFRSPTMWLWTSQIVPCIHYFDKNKTKHREILENLYHQRKFPLFLHCFPAELIKELSNYLTDRCSFATPNDYWEHPYSKKSNRAIESSLLKYVINFIKEMNYTKTIM